jgi:hypothetical protein
MQQSCEKSRSGWDKVGHVNGMVETKSAIAQPSDGQPATRGVGRAVTQFLAHQANLFAILDGASGDRVSELLHTKAKLAAVPDPPAELVKPVSPSSLVFQSLYLTASLPEIAESGPYLVQLPKGNDLLPTIVEEGFGDSWGIFVTSRDSFAEVRKHFRHFLKVRHPEGDSIVFRFFDPRILNAFLPVCTTDELHQFFGTVQSFFAEREGMSGMEAWRFESGQLIQSSVV